MKSQSNAFTVNPAVGTFEEYVAKDKYRSQLKIQNTGSDAVFVFTNETGVASEANSIKIDAGSFYEPFVAPTGAIQIATDSTAGSPSSVVIDTSIPSVLRVFSFGMIALDDVISLGGNVLPNTGSIFSSSEGSAGVFWSDNQNTIVYTKDSGATWTVEDTSTVNGGQTLAGCIVRPSDGEIYYTTTNGTIWRVDSVGSHSTQGTLGINMARGQVLEIHPLGALMGCSGDDDRIGYTVDTVDWTLGGGNAIVPGVGGFGYKAIINASGGSDVFVRDNAGAQLGILTGSNPVGTDFSLSGIGSYADVVGGTFDRFLESSLTLSNGAWAEIDGSLYEVDTTSGITNTVIQTFESGYGAGSLINTGYVESHENKDKLSATTSDYPATTGSVDIVTSSIHAYVSFGTDIFGLGNTLGSTSSDSVFKFTSEI